MMISHSKRVKLVQFVKDMQFCQLPHTTLFDSNKKYQRMFERHLMKINTQYSIQSILSFCHLANCNKRNDAKYGNDHATNARNNRKY